METEVFCAFAYAVNMSSRHHKLYYRDAKGRLTDAYISICYPRDLFASFRPQYFEACMFGPSSNPDPIVMAFAQRFGEVPRRSRHSDMIPINRVDPRITSEINRDQMDLIVDSVMRADAAGEYDDYKRRILGENGELWMLDHVMTCAQRTNPGPVYESKAKTESESKAKAKAKTESK